MWEPHRQPQLCQRHRSRHDPCRSPGLDITITPGGRQATHTTSFSMFLTLNICFSSQHICLSLPFPHHILAQHNGAQDKKRELILPSLVCHVATWANETHSSPLALYGREANWPRGCYSGRVGPACHQWQHSVEWAPHCASRADPIGLGVGELKARKLLTVAVCGLAVSLPRQFTLTVLRRESRQADQPTTLCAQNEGYMLVPTNIHLKYELWSMWRGWTCRSKAAGFQWQKATISRCPRGSCIKLEVDVNGLELDQRLIILSTQK